MLPFFRLAEIGHFLFQYNKKNGNDCTCHDLSSCHPFLINFSKLLVGPEVSFNRKLNCILQAGNIYENISQTVVRGNVIFFVCLAEHQFPGQCAHALDAPHVEQNSSCCELHVKPEKGS